MAYPPKGHSDRPLRLAARAMMVLGIVGGVLALAGAVLGARAVYEGLVPTHQSTGPHEYDQIGNLIVGVSALVAVPFLLLLGASSFLSSVSLQRHRRWGAVLGLITVGVIGLTSLLAVVSVFRTAMTDGGLALALTLAGLGLCSAMGLLSCWLIGSFDAIRLAKREKSADRAFEIGGPRGHGIRPIMAEAVQQPPPSQNRA